MAEVRIKVAREYAQEVRDLIASRVRLRCEERRGWFSTTFVFSGPDEVVSAVHEEIKDLLHERWLGMQI